MLEEDGAIFEEQIGKQKRFSNHRMKREESESHKQENEEMGGT